MIWKKNSIKMTTLLSKIIGSDCTLKQQIGSFSWIFENVNAQKMFLFSFLFLFSTMFSLWFWLSTRSMVINQKRKFKETTSLNEFNDLLNTKTKDERTLHFLAYSNIIWDKDFAFFICDLCDVKQRNNNHFSIENHLIFWIYRPIWTRS